MLLAYSAVGRLQSGALSASTATAYIVDWWIACASYTGAPTAEEESALEIRPYLLYLRLAQCWQLIGQLASCIPEYQLGGCSTAGTGCHWLRSRQPAAQMR